MRKINLIVLHCSDSDVPAHDNPETINEWHIQRGFSGIGYHYIITQDGVVHQGRAEGEVGAGVKGHNANALHICLTGRHKFSPKQYLSLNILCKSRCKHHDLDKSDIIGHCDLDPKKTCPNFPHREIISAWEWH